MTDPNASIAIFDSGLGGLTVFRALKELLPKENLLYFGDTARIPYGNKRPETILSYCKQAAQFLETHNIKILILACHTACAAALKELRADLNVPVIAILEQAIDQVSLISNQNKIAILGTQATLSTGAFQKQISERLPHAELTTIACPLFVPLVEEGFISHALTRLAIKEYLSPLKENKIDTVLLGCTHYPLLQQLIAQELGSDVTLMDPATACAKKVQEVLAETHLLNEQTSSPLIQFYVSDDPDKFRKIGSLILQEPIASVEIAQL
ncbi:MAG: glutamate racemase [Rhabdochlamydiaceae bacterium]|nr:glutamate racemase [Rhabdochlamydiaceae bacterium]